MSVSERIAWCDVKELLFDSSACLTSLHALHELDATFVENCYASLYEWRMTKAIGRDEQESDRRSALSLIQSKCANNNCMRYLIK